MNPNPETPRFTIGDVVRTKFPNSPVMTVVDIHYVFLENLDRYAIAFYERVKDVSQKKPDPTEYTCVWFDENHVLRTQVLRDVWLMPVGCPNLIKEK